MERQKATFTEVAGVICIVASGTIGTYIAGVEGLAVALMGMVGVLLVFVGVMQE